MKSFILILAIVFVMLSGCQNSSYTMEDYASVKKLDSHIHIRSSDGVFEGIAAADNFVLISLNVDHTDSADIRVQQDFAAASAKKYPGKVFFGPTFFFDTTGWGTDTWSKKIIT